MAKILNGGSLEGLLPTVPLGEYLLEGMETAGNGLSLTNFTLGTRFTFRDMVLVVRELARGLQALGLTDGDVVSLYVSNCEEFVMLAVASVHAGLIVNPINPAATPRELQHYFKEVQPKLILTENALIENVETAMELVKYKPVVVLREKTKGYRNLHELRKPDIWNIQRTIKKVKEDVVFILFSSGTTGLPKGVMLTHLNILSQVYARLKEIKVEDSPTRVGLFPMYHVAGLSGLCTSLRGGNHLVFLEKYKIELFLDAIQTFKPIEIAVPPSVIVQLNKSPLVERYDTSSVAICRSGAAPLAKDTEEAFRKRFNVDSVRQGYGLTETSAGVVWYTPEPGSQAGRGSNGRVKRGVEIKIIAADGQLLGPNCRGEILIRSPMVMKGYLNNPKATRETLDSEGWLHSGDIGYYDDQGYVYVVDRIKELIKFKGNQVAPAELEALLLEHPDVGDVGVIGVPDVEAGELPRAYVVRVAGSNVTAQTLQDYVKAKASHYKQLRGGVVFIQEIPKLPSGKILRRQLKDLAFSAKSKL